MSVLATSAVPRRLNPLKLDIYACQRCLG